MTNGVMIDTFSHPAKNLLHVLEVKAKSWRMRHESSNSAYLHGANLIDAGQDARGYRFVGVRQNDGELMIAAGCRWLSLADAKAHWQDRHTDNAALHAECLGKINLIEAVATARGEELDR